MKDCTDYPGNDTYWLEERRQRAENLGFALATGRDPKTAFSQFATPRKPAASTLPTPMPPQPGTEQFIRSVEQECPECAGSCLDQSATEQHWADAPDCPACGGTGRTIVTRNFLAEAFSIAANPDSIRPIERAHLVAIIQHARQFVSAAVSLPDVTLPDVA